MDISQITSDPSEFLLAFNLSVQTNSMNYNLHQRQSRTVTDSIWPQHGNEMTIVWLCFMKLTKRNIIITHKKHSRTWFFLLSENFKFFIYQWKAGRKITSGNVKKVSLWIFLLMNVCESQIQLLIYCRYSIICFAKIKRNFFANLWILNKNNV